MNIRRELYRAARMMGDARAVKNGTVMDRIVRRLAGKLTSRMLGKLPAAKTIKKITKI